MKLSRVHDETAQGVLEFAFIVSALMLLFLGTFDYARFLYYDTAIHSAARVGAEMASNHCISATSCADTHTGASAVTDQYVLWSTYCEANAYVSINPSYSSCTPGTSSTWTPSCASASCTNCSNDICVYPEDTRNIGNEVTVSVGYNYHPITFMLDWLFQTQSCWTAANGAPQDDSTSHTLCATSVGKVS